MFGVSYIPGEAANLSLGLQSEWRTTFFGSSVLQSEPGGSNRMQCWDTFGAVPRRQLLGDVVVLCFVATVSALDCFTVLLLAHVGFQKIRARPGGHLSG